MTMMMSGLWPKLIAGMAARKLQCTFVCACLVAGCAGCASPGQKVFDSATITSSWKNVPNHDLYWNMDSLAWQGRPRVEPYWVPLPHWYIETTSDGHEVYYAIVTNEDGTIVAKAREQRDGRVSRCVFTTGECLRELMQVAEHFPFFDGEVPLPGTEFRVKVSSYPPLAKPNSPEDKILPSGTRESTWAGLVDSLQGWPFAAKDARITAWVDGHEVGWEALKAKLKEKEVDGLVKLVESGAIDSGVVPSGFPGLVEQWLINRFGSPRERNLQTGPALTLCDMCISQYHIDHILIMVYIAESYSVKTARSAGQYKESFWLGFWTEGSEVEGSDNAVSNADLNFNEVALCISKALKHADANGGKADRVTRAEICACTKAVGAATRKAIAKKPGKGGGGNTDYHDCKPCEKAITKPNGLKQPPLDL